MNSGVCACGCGQRTKLAPRTKNGVGWVKGEPLRFLKGHSLTRVRPSGQNHPNWKGGKAGAGNGYILVHRPGHPRANKRGYVYEHILVACNALGKPIPATAQVHHINENRADNRPENLVVCQDTNYHTLLHQRTRAYRACGHADWAKCWICKEWSPKDTLRFPRPNQKGSPYHLPCVAKKQGEYRAKRA